MRLTHVRLLVDDLRACVDFYRDVLGLELAEDFGGYVEFAAGGVALALFAREGQGEVVEVRPPGDGAVLGFGVESADAAAEQLREHEADAPLAYPEVHNLTAPLRAAARERGDADGFHLWAGEAYPLAAELPAGELVRRLADEAGEALASAGRALAHRPERGREDA